MPTMDSSTELSSPRTHAFPPRASSRSSTSDNGEPSRRKHSRGDSFSSIQSSDSAAVMPRSSSLVNMPRSGGPKTLSPLIIDKPGSAADRWRQQQQQLSARSSSGASSPASIPEHGSPADSAQLSRTLTSDRGLPSQLSAPQLRAGPASAPLSPPKPYLPQRSPLRKQQQLPVPQTDSTPNRPRSRTEGFGKGLPSSVASIAHARPSTDSRPSFDVNGRPVTSELGSLTPSLRLGSDNRSQTSLHGSITSGKSGKNKSNKWNPLKDVFGDGEASPSSSFARSVRAKARKMSRAKDSPFSPEDGGSSLWGSLPGTPRSERGESSFRGRRSVSSAAMPDAARTEEDKIAQAKKNAVDRANTMRELLETEKSYAIDLGVVRDIFLGRARAKLAAASAQSPALGTPILSGALLASPTTSTRPRLASNSSFNHARQGSTDSNSLLGSPFAGQQRLPLNPTSNRSSVYTFASSKTSDSVDHAGAAAMIVPPQQRASQGSNGMLRSPSSESLGTAPHGGSMLGHESGSASPHPSPLLAHLSAPFSNADLRVIFANVEDCTQFAESMSRSLATIVHEMDVHDNSATGERLAEFFTDAVSQAPLVFDYDCVLTSYSLQLPRLTQIYGAYCTSHAASMQRLQDLLASSALTENFIKETMVEARHFTNAWDLASLLIKPVQRVMKYPLLMQQIVKKTDPEADDYAALSQACVELEALADRINELKRKQDLIDDIVNNRTTPSSRSSAANGRANKKVKKSSRPRGSAGTLAGTDDFGGLVEQLHSVEISLLSFSRSVAEWVRASKQALDQESKLVGRWAQVHQALSAGSAEETAALVAPFSDLVRGDLQGIWVSLDDAVHSYLLPLIEEILAMFVGPKTIIQQHDEREVDHARWSLAMSKSDRRPSDQRMMDSANEYAAFHSQLIEDLPPFLTHARLLFDRCVLILASIQRSYYGAIQSRLNQFLADSRGANSLTSSAAASSAPSRTSYEPLSHDAQFTDQLDDSFSPKLGGTTTLPAETETMQSRSPIHESDTPLGFTPPQGSSPQPPAPSRDSIASASDSASSHVLASKAKELPLGSIIPMRALADSPQKGRAAADVEDRRGSDSFTLTPMLNFKAGEVLHVFASSPSPRATPRPSLSLSSSNHASTLDDDNSLGLPNVLEHVLARTSTGDLGWVERKLFQPLSNKDQAPQSRLRP